MLISKLLYIVCSSHETKEYKDMYNIELLYRTTTIISGLDNKVTLVKLLDKQQTSLNKDI